MGDRVAIIGGETASRDCLPYIGRSWIAASGASGAGRGSGYSFPWGFDAAEYLRYHSRVKRWKITADIGTVYKSKNSSDPSDTGYTTATATLHIVAEYQFLVIDVNADPEGSPYLRPDRESDLVRDPGIHSFTIVGDSFGGYEIIWFNDESDSVFFENISVTGTIANTGESIGFELTQALIAATDTNDKGGWVSNQFWPKIEILAGNTASSWQGRGFADPIGTLTLESKTTSIQGIIPVGNPTFGTPFDYISSLNATIIPIEYWPYATKPSDDHPDGEDVYDTATGAQLRDPLS